VLIHSEELLYLLIIAVLRGLLVDFRVTFATSLVSWVVVDSQAKLFEML